MNALDGGGEREHLKLLAGNYVPRYSTTVLLFMNPPTLNDFTAKLILGHVHRVGMAITALESELQGTPATTAHMKIAISNMQSAIRQAMQEIIDLRDGKDS